MALVLDSITFNHDTGSAATSAMNIRRNKDFEVLVPEFEAAVPRPVAESCAAYAIEETEGQNVFVRVGFGSTEGGSRGYQVRARGGGLLGRLRPRTVSFLGGATSATVDFPLSRRRFDRVTRRDVSWRWQYRRLGARRWHALRTTSHRIYVVLKVPSAPFSQALADKRNPWTDLLDVCCLVASGSKDAAAVTSHITKDVHRSYPLRYDVETGAPRYGYFRTGTSFQLTNWIQYVLKGNAPGTPVFCNGMAEQHPDFWIVNCYDCAASSALMSRILGADSDYYFHQPFGYLNYVEPIGRGKCNDPFYGCSGSPAVGPDDMRSRFGNHAYQKLGGARNYDACMREWLSPTARAFLILIWFIILVLTMGLVNLQSLLDRANGWLLDLPQPDYETRTVDISQPFESSAASGATQTLQTLQFSVT